MIKGRAKGERQRAKGEGERTIETGEGQGAQDLSPLAFSHSPMYVILAKAEAEQVMILNPVEGKPRILKKRSFYPYGQAMGQQPSALSNQ